MKPNTSTRYLVIGLLAFLVGVAGTVLVMSRRGQVGKTDAPTADAGHREGGEGHGGEAHEGEAHEGGHEDDGMIQLPAVAVKNAGIRSEPVRSSLRRAVLTVPGTVEASADRIAKITPPASGRVVRIHAKLGDAVRQGQPLVVIDSFEVAQAHAALQSVVGEERQAIARLQTARAEVEGARAGVGQSRAEVSQALTRQRSAEIALSRQREFARAGAFSQAPLQTAQSELSEAQSELLQAQTELQSHLAALQRAERLFKEGIAARAELEQAQLEHHQDQARVERARSRVATAKLTLEREQRISQGDLLSKQAVQTAEAEVREARGDVLKARSGVTRAEQEVRRAQREADAAVNAVRGARQAVAAARSNLFALEGGGHAEGGGGLVTVPAPLSGVVAEQHVTLGESVERSDTLYVIENRSSVTVQANVHEAEIPRVRVGQPVEVTVASYPDQRFPGIVKSLATRVDEKTRTLAVRCLVENRAGRLRPEMFAQVTLQTDAPQRAVLVPQSALVEGEGGERAVFVETPKGYERRPVRIAGTFGEEAEVASGLNVGERVVTEGAFILKSESMKGELAEGHDH